MSKIVFSLLTSCVLLTASDVFGQRFTSDEHRAAHEHGWIFDYDEAKALARRTNRPMMVVFRCVP